MGGGQDKPAWTACPLGVKITRVGGKITRDSLLPGGQAVQGGKINCYTGNISTLHCDIKNRRISAPHMLDLVFLDWHNFINNEDI